MLLWYHRGIARVNLLVSLSAWGRVRLAVPSRSHKHRQPGFDPQIVVQKTILTLALTLTLTLTLSRSLILEAGIQSLHLLAQPES